MMIYAVDPGTTHSGVVLLGPEDDGPPTVVRCAVYPNEEVLTVLRGGAAIAAKGQHVLVLEMIESMGMSVGQDVFRTVHWGGRFHEAWEGYGVPVEFVTRRQVKLAMCASARANDGNIRTAILDRYGGAGAVGTKKHPGPLFGVKTHGWSALAVGLTYLARHELPPEPRNAETR
jgi:hypothetical protein